MNGQLQRCPTRPFVPPQSVTDHAWHVSVILSLIDPDSVAEDLKAALLCDVDTLKDGDVSPTLKGDDVELAGSEDGRPTEPKVPRTSHEAEHSDALTIAVELADLWLLAVQSRLGNQEATAVFTRHRERIEAMDLTKFPAAVILRDAIERWCMYGSAILCEEVT